MDGVGPAVGVRSAADVSPVSPTSDTGLDAVEGPTTADEDGEDPGGLQKHNDDA